MLNVVEAFSGIGSQAKALKKLGIDYKVVNILEWDISAFVAYDFIHNGAPDITPYKNLTKLELLERLVPLNLSSDGKNPISRIALKAWSVESLRIIWAAYNRTRNLGDIQKVDHLTFPSDVDVLTYSFPCQDLSIGGAWHNNHSGIDRDANNRSGLLWEVERILESIQMNGKELPRFLLMENVSNILSKRHASNFNDWKNQLERLGYYNKVYTLDASNFGSPQRRVRTFMVSVLLPNNDIQTFVEQYFKDNDLEEIANGFEGVQNSFALQAGREIRIMVNPGKIKDDKVTILAHKVREKIENNLDYPGNIKVTVIRELRAVDYAK